MAKFSVEGDEDGNEEEPSNNRRLPKKPRTSSDLIALKRASASTSNSGDRAAAFKAGNPASTSTASQTPLVRESRLDEQALMESDDDEVPLVFTRSSVALISRYDDDDDDDDEELIDIDEEPISVDEEPISVEFRSRDQVQPTEARINSTPNGNGTGPVSVTLTDPDVLDCSICFEPLNPPVYQCENGHIACPSCCINMKNKCASCSWPIGYNRCRAIEKVLESIKISCPNTQYGCKASLNYSKKLDHEKTCNYAPCSCPHPDCTYIGLPNNVYSHFATRHSNSSKMLLYDYAFSVPLVNNNNQKHVFFREKFEDTLFVLNRSIEPRGSFINVVCIAPNSSKKRFSYELSATDGVSSIRLKTVAEMTPQWTGQPPDKKYLLVPNDFVTSDGQLKLELTIRRDPGLRSPQTQK